MIKDKKILVHSCCAPCSGSVFEKLAKDGYLIDSLFFNPNIYPLQEYERRRDELIRFSTHNKFKVIIKEDFSQWIEAVKDFESEKEGGKRCEICFSIRLEETAKYAKENNYDIFTTVLTVSPHKNSKVINEIGKSLQLKYGIDFLEADFKKNDGFKRSMELSKLYDFYRQNYCGCKYSIKNK